MVEFRRKIPRPFVPQNSEEIFIHMFIRIYENSRSLKQHAQARKTRLAFLYMRKGEFQLRRPKADVSLDEEVVTSRSLTFTLDN